MKTKLLQRISIIIAVALVLAIGGVFSLLESGEHFFSMGMTVPK